MCGVITVVFVGGTYHLMVGMGKTPKMERPIRWPLPKE